MMLGNLKWQQKRLSLIRIVKIILNKLGLCVNFCEKEANIQLDDLISQCDLQILSQNSLAECEPFVCSKKDLTDFFSEDFAIYEKLLLGKTYVFRFKHNPSIIACAFTVSNDSISLTDKIDVSDKNTFLEESDLQAKKMKRFPSVLIGRLGVNEKFEGRGYGSALMDFIKMWFLISNKTACRFIIVDAYNDEKTLHYYQKNGFKFLIQDERSEAKYMEINAKSLPLKTRHMYYDLLNANIQ